MTPEKRKTRRIPVQVPASLIDPDRKTESSCAVMDISPGGIGVLLSLDQAVAPQGVLRFGIDTPPEKVFASGKVMWVRVLQQGKPYNYAAGLRFSEEGDTCQSKQALLDYARSLAGRYEEQILEVQEFQDRGLSESNDP